VVDLDVLGGHTDAAERIHLVVGVLVGGRDARVSEEHSVENTGPARIFVVVCRRGFSTRFRVEALLSRRVSANDRFSSLCIAGAFHDVGDVL
jgi:hypothetical protein